MLCSLLLKWVGLVLCAHVLITVGVHKELELDMEVCLVLLLAIMPLNRGADIIPDSFPARDLSSYTVRYLSESGNDTESCLSGQSYPLTNATTRCCRSFGYSLTGGHYFRSSNKSNVIILIFPGNYTMGKRGVEIFDYYNVILSKMPDTVGEVVIKCNEYFEDDYNNLFVADGVNFALSGLVFTECGSYSTPVRLQNTLNAVISNSIFRLVHSERASA